MACIINDPKLIGCVTQLKTIIQAFEDDVDTLHTKIYELRKTNSDLSNDEFNTCLESVGLNPEQFTSGVTATGKLSPALVLSNLAYDNYQTIFAGALSAWGWMQHYFKSNFFQHAFVTTDKKVKASQLISKGPQDFNRRIARFKNFLFAEICDVLNITELTYKDKTFDASVIKKGPFSQFAKDVNIDLYNALMSDNRVTTLVRTMLDGAIKSNPIGNARAFDAFSALFILNNFDQCISGTDSSKHGDMDKLVKLDITKKGALQNTDYTFDPEGTEPDIWVAHTVETSGAEQYSSSLGKFILAQIPMRDSQGNIIPGRYMREQDAFVVSAILKDLEMEYLIMNPDSKLSLRNGGKKALRLLLQEGKGLKAFDRYRVRLLPIIKFLYEGDEDVYSIKEATQLAQEATGQVNLLDVESVLAFELTKQYAPAYLEYTTVQKDALGRPSENIIRAINNGKTYRATNSVKEQVSNYLTQLAQGSNFYIPNLFKGEEKTLEEKLKKEDITIDHILAAVKNTESAQGLVLEILEAFEHLFDSPFTMDIVYDMTSSTTTETSKHRESINKILSLLNTARSVFKQVKFVDKLKDGFETRFDELLEEQMFKSRDFKRLAMNLKEGLSDIPVINFTSGRGTSIPVYKINSAIADDVNYIHRYKSNSPIRKLLNIFVAYPQLLSNINKVESGVQPVYNEDYPGATGLKLETILESGSNPNSKGSAGHSSKNSFLGDFLGLGRIAHAMAVQPLPYSDKSSAFTKNLNLDVEMEFPSFNKTLNKVETIKTTLFNATNDQIARLYFNFEKRKQLDIVIKVLNDWKRVLDLDIQIPSVTDSFVFPTSLARVIDTWHEVDNYLTEHQITFDGIRSKIFLILQSDPLFEMTDDLLYRQYSDTPYLSLNNSIFSALLRVKDFESFESDLLSWANKFKLEQSTQEIAKILGIGETEESPYAHLLRVFPQCKSFDDLIYRYTLLTNLVKDQYLDLNFKGVYLDKIKCLKPTDEEMGEIEESLNLKAGSKRTVAMGGTGSYYQLGLLTGVASECKSMIFTEPREQAFSPFGKTTTVEIFNGAGFTSPIFARQQTASLPGDRFNGMNRKTLGMAVNDYRSTLYKWAEYPMSNWHMRVSGNSKFRMEYIFKLMHNIIWQEDIDLTKNLFGKTIKLPDIYFSKGINHYRINNIERIGKNQYKINIHVVDEVGNILAEQVIPSNLFESLTVQDKAVNPANDPTIVQIDSLYKLWKVLGGAESEQMSPHSGLVYSEASLDLLYNYVVNVGYKKVDDVDGELIQDNFEQPLRKYFISIAASDSGVKRAVGNRNKTNVWYTDPDTGLEYLTTVIQTNDISKSLDASHELDDESENKEQTQTMSTAASRGTDPGLVEEMYNAIGNIIQDGLKDLNKQLVSVQYGRHELVLRQISQEIVEATQRDSNINSLTPIIEIISKGLNDILPPSSPMFFKSMVKRVIQDLNDKGLIRRYSGSADVLNPTSNLIQIYTLNDVKKTRELIIRDARRAFLEIPQLAVLTTDELIKLYQYCKGKVAAGQARSEFDAARQILLVQPVLSQFDTTVEFGKLQFVLNGIKFMPPNTDYMDVSNYEYEDCTIKISDFTSISPLTPIYYRTKNHNPGEAIRTTLNNIDHYIDFMWQVKNGEVVEVYHDLLTPHDLKMQNVKYKTSEGRIENFIGSSPTLTKYLFNRKIKQRQEAQKAKQIAASNSENLKQQCQ